MATFLAFKGDTCTYTTEGITPTIYSGILNFCGNFYFESSKIRHSLNILITTIKKNN